MNQQAKSVHLLPLTNILVDGFRFASSDVTAYILTHFHSDHYGGLTDAFPNGNDGARIYCTPITAALVENILGVEPRHIVAVPFDTPFSVPANQSGEMITARFLAANHCPGAAMVLVEGGPLGNKRLLHCGDMRYHVAMTGNPLLCPGSIDEVLLDTTYAHPKHVFPSQAACVRHAVDVVRAHLEGRIDAAMALSIDDAKAPLGNYKVTSSKAAGKQVAVGDADMTPTEPQYAGLHGPHVSLAPICSPSPLVGLDPQQHARDGESSTLFLVSAYVVGKERILVELARSLKLRVYVPASKLRIVQHLGLRAEDFAWFTADRTAASIHVTSMGSLGRAWPYFQPNFDGMLHYLRQVNRLHALAAAGQLPQSAAGVAAAAADASSSSSASSASRAPVSYSALEAAEEAEEKLFFEQASSAADDYDDNSATAEECSPAPPRKRARSDVSSPMQSSAAAASFSSVGNAAASGRYSRVVGIVPTGWVHTNKKKVFVWPWKPDDGAPSASSSTAAAPQPSVDDDMPAATAVIHTIPYSEHSSFDELVEFVRHVKPRKISPTVYSDEDDKRKILERFAHLVDSTAAKKEFLKAFQSSSSSSSSSSFSNSSASAGASRVTATSLSSSGSLPTAVMKSSAASSAKALKGALDDDDIIEIDSSSEAVSSSSTLAKTSTAAGYCHACQRDVSITAKGRCSRCTSEFVERRRT